jgi:hypothetical protein
MRFSVMVFCIIKSIRCNDYGFKTFFIQIVVQIVKHPIYSEFICSFIPIFSVYFTFHSTCSQYTQCFIPHIIHICFVPMPIKCTNSADSQYTLNVILYIRQRVAQINRNVLSNCFSSVAFKGTLKFKIWDVGELLEP